MMKKKPNKMLHYSIISLLVATLSMPFLFAYFYMPNQIYLIAGKEHEIHFKLPMQEAIHFKMDQPGQTKLKLSLMGILPIKSVDVDVLPYKELIPSGKLVGIQVDSKGVCVLGTSDMDVKGKSISPVKGLLKEGDIIIKANNAPVVSKEKLRELIEDTKEGELELTILRDSIEEKIKIKPVYSNKDNTYKIGAWIKDSAQGIGTLTYIDPQNLTFGALGHGITDKDIKKLLPIKGGQVTKASITSIKKGEKGQPGEIGGRIDYTSKNRLGDISKNTSLGVYGKLSKEMSGPLARALPIAFQDEIHEGRAYILLNLEEDKIRSYEICIQKINHFTQEPTKGMVIKITDERLLEVTGGIIQGMSGSPIIQDGKLIGAITHVFVQDPTRGYGIFIENMVANENFTENGID
jgi:stage IV sporulation protein B